MRHVLIAAVTLVLAACSVEPGSEKWCEQKKEQPKSEWTASDAKTFMRNCVLEGSAIGSEEWCKDLADKPKGDWTANESASYAKHCVM